MNIKIIKVVYSILDKTYQINIKCNMIKNLIVASLLFEICKIKANEENVIAVNLLDKLLMNNIHIIKIEEL